MTEEYSIAQQNLGIGGERALDPKQLKYITENFTTLQQGLGCAASGATFAAWQILYWQGSPLMRLVGILLMAGTPVVYDIYIPRYIRSRFGWIEQQKLPPGERPLFTGIGEVILLGFLITLWIVCVAIQEVNGFQGPINFATLIQSLGLLCMILYASFAHVRVMPVTLLVGTAGALAQALLALVPFWVPLGPRQMLLWKLLNTGSMGVLLMLMGLCNYIMVLRLLPKRDLENESD
jgi:hypothetical protein